VKGGKGGRVSDITDIVFSHEWNQSSGGRSRHVAKDTRTEGMRWPASVRTLDERPIAMENRPIGGSHFVVSSSNSSQQATMAASFRTLRRREADRKVTV
jgi:hypothetical protein